MKANILTGRGMDRVSLETNLPGPFPGENLCLDFVTPKGDAVGYLAHTFPTAEITIHDVTILADRVGKDAVVHDRVQRWKSLEADRQVPGSLVSGSLGLSIELPQEGRDAQAPE